MAAVLRLKSIAILIHSRRRQRGTSQGSQKCQHQVGQFRTVDDISTVALMGQFLQLGAGNGGGNSAAVCRADHIVGAAQHQCRHLNTVETEKFKGLNFPLITLERSMDEGTLGIECDNYQGGVMATELLINKGCHKLMYIGGMSAGNDVHMPADDREVAFRNICESTHTDKVVMVTDEQLFDSMEYYEFVRKALTEHPDVDGVFASSDVIGAHVLQVCSHLGIKVPEELKIVGFDDVNIAQLTSPGLTSIHQPIEQMAEMAVLTISQIDMGKMMPSKTVFPVTLVERGTT